MVSNTMRRINSRDIYKEEIDKSIKTLKHFREAWMRLSSTIPKDLFQYADDDFYFYRFCINSQENETEKLTFFTE